MRLPLQMEKMMIKSAAKAATPRATAAAMSLALSGASPSGQVKPLSDLTRLLSGSLPVKISIILLSEMLSSRPYLASEVDALKR